MAIEIERKFLVHGDFSAEVESKSELIQAYISTNPKGTVRIRLENKKAFLTIKGESTANGLSRYEWEKKIPYHEALELLNLCENALIEKTRFRVKSAAHTFEVDQFHGDNQGLVIAEIELENENEYFEKPLWLGQEVTGKPEYYNAMLSKNPYKNWK